MGILNDLLSAEVVRPQNTKVGVTNGQWEMRRGTHKFYVKHNINVYSPNIAFKSSIQENASALSCFKDRMTE